MFKFLISRVLESTLLTLSISIFIQANFTDACDCNQPYTRLNSTTIYGVSTPLISDNGNNVSQFTGIRYAPQPVRFSLAEPYTLNEKTINATSYGATCIQNIEGGPGSQALSGTDVESEDCLSLNVWTPAITESPCQTYSPPLLPVMFFMYGGFLQFGSSNETFYNGATLASHDVVVITINYRTNVFGFPSASQLPVSMRNLGYFDQRLALKWVRDNIHAFGGDKDKITIFGQSAGAASVDSFLLEGPAENPPFRGAILESGSEYLFLPSTDSSNKFDTLARAVGCAQGNGTQGQLQCMRNVSAIELQKYQEKLALSFYSEPDNVTTFENPVGRRASGKSANVPIIIGTNLNEGSILTLGQTNLTAYIIENFPNIPIKTLKKLYPVPQVYESDEEAISAIYTDYMFHCPARITAEAASRYVAPAYRYLFNVTFANTQPVPNFSLGVYHASEIPLAFGNVPKGNATAQEIALSQYMQSVWTGFAKNPKRGPWPYVESYEQDLAVLGLDGSAGATLVSPSAYDNICNFWNPYILKTTGAS